MNLIAVPKSIFDLAQFDFAERAVQVQHQLEQ